MSNVYRAGMNAMMSGLIDWDNAGTDIRAILIAPTYTPNHDTHEDLADVPSADRYGDTPEIAVAVPGRSLVNVATGIVEARATALTFLSVPDETVTAVVASILIYLHNASEALATLICLDTLTTAPTPDGNNIVYTPAATGIFKLDGGP